MQKITLFIFFFLFVYKLQANTIKANFSYSSFCSSDNIPYIETYLSIVGNSVIYKKTPSGNYQATIQVTYIFYQDNEIKDFRKYNILSPEVTDTTIDLNNFIDQQRISIPNGKYILKLSVEDNNANQKPLTAKQPIEINYHENTISMSDIELVETITKTKEASVLSKSGYDLLPYVYDFFPETIRNLTFYAEIYHTDKILQQDDAFTLNCYVESFEKKNKVAFLSQTTQPLPCPVYVVLKEFDIAQLPSGNYTLVVEVLNKDNRDTLIRKTLFFQRSNPVLQSNSQDFSILNTHYSFVDNMHNKDSLMEHIRSLQPISTPLELSFADNQLKQADLHLAQQFFLGFWLSRNSTQPEQAWLDYKLEVDKVNHDFSTSIRKGYETDRGRIYLKYGHPNKRIEQKSEPSAYPYEIWHYYTTEKQSNAKFVFYEPSLVTNDYILLHSNVTGEINNYRWQLDLYRRNESDDNLDIKKGSEHWGRQAEELYNNPR